MKTVKSKTPENIKSLLDDIDRAEAEIRILREDVHMFKGRIIETLVKAKAWDCFTVNMSKVRKYYS